MRKFKLKIKYPDSPNVGTIFTEQSNGNYAKDSYWINKKDIIDFPHLWEEVVDDFRILSFKNTSHGKMANVQRDNFYRLNFDIDSNDTGYDSLSVMLKMVTEGNYYIIEVVQRTKDKEIFKVGDYIQVGNGNVIHKIKKFRFDLVSNKIEVHFEDHAWRYLDNITKYKKYYQILSFRGTLNKEVKYEIKSNGCYQNPSSKYKYNEYKISSLLGNSITEIYSVKRLSDGVIFTVGNKVRTLKNTEFFIESFSQLSDKSGNLEVKGKDKNGNNYSPSIDNINITTAVFTTEDGVQIFEGETFFIVDSESNCPHMVSHSQSYKTDGDKFKFVASLESVKQKQHLYFSTKDKALDYLKQFEYLDEKFLSIKDVLRLTPPCCVDKVKERLVVLAVERGHKKK